MPAFGPIFLRFAIIADSLGKNDFPPDGINRMGYVDKIIRIGGLEVGAMVLIRITGLRLMGLPSNAQGTAV